MEDYYDTRFKRVEDYYDSGFKRVLDYYDTGFFQRCAIQSDSQVPIFYFLPEKKECLH